MKRLSVTFCAILLAITGTFAQVNLGKMSSYPSASATIFLDFDGQTVVSPYWNGGMPIYAAAPALTEAQILRVFNQVSEDFRPFNVNITTDSTVYFAAPATKRQRVIITSTSSWYGSAGGVAWVESFRWGLEVPAFVFANLLSNNSKMVSEATSHETGHTLGLYHQSQYSGTTFVQEYNPGIGSGEISWAPIMGNSYSRNLTLWHNGPNSFGSTSMQDELSIISGSGNGFGYRTDDVGNTTAAAANVTFNANSYGINGFINSTGDIDMYRVALTTKGRLVLDAIPYNIASGNQSANIDLSVSLLKSNGTVIATYNPSTSVEAIIDTVLDAGTYFYRVSNTSNTNTTNYGMLGNYTMTGTFSSGASLPIYSLILGGSVTNNKHDLNWSIIADEGIESIVVEVSNDGKTFNKLQDVNGTSRKFSYVPSASGVLYYRLYVTTASQLKYYSNIISLKEASTNARFNVMSNLISNTLVVNSNGTYNWRLVDMNGRMLQTGKMSNGINRIDATRLSSGMYLLQIIDGTEIATQKLVKQ
ncbi:MAG: zinc-dependent metalloprotease [Chitinophagaceae bacterium]